MNIDATWLLICAIKSKLQADQTLQNLMGVGFAVADFHNEGSVPKGPFVYMGRTHAQAWHSATFDGQEHEIDIHVTCDESESPHAQELCGGIINALHDSDMPLAGHALVDMQFERSETRHCASLKSFITTVTFKALTVSD